MSRRFAIFLGLALPFVLLAAACGGDDDDSGSSGDDDDDDDDSEDIGRSDHSDATGKLTLDGKEYSMDVETCVINEGPSKLTVVSARLSGNDQVDEFSASGIEDTVAMAVTKGNTGYIAAGVKLKIDGKSISFDGEVIDPAAPAKPLKLKFSTKC